MFNIVAIRRHGAALIAAMLFLTGAQAGIAADSPCRLVRDASLDISYIPNNGRPAVDIKVNGVPVHLLVDTGGGFTMLNEDIARLLKMEPVSLSARQLSYRYFGGATPTKYAVSDTLDIGEMHQEKFAFLVGAPQGIPGADGLIGADILSSFDVEFDFAANKLNLFEPHECPGSPVYWTKEPAARLSFAGKPSGHVRLPAKLNGRSIDAVLDTGATFTVMGYETTADLLGWPDDGKPEGMLPSDRFKLGGRYRFRSLTIGGVALRDPLLEVATEKESTFKQDYVLVGIDVLRQLHLYIAYKERAVYVTRAETH